MKLTLLLLTLHLTTSAMAGSLKTVVVKNMMYPSADLNRYTEVEDLLQSGQVKTACPNGVAKIQRYDVSVTADTAVDGLKTTVMSYPKITRTALIECR